MTKQETPIYKKIDLVIDELYSLEDMTQYNCEEISKAIEILNSINIDKLLEDNYIVTDKENV